MSELQTWARRCHLAARTSLIDSRAMYLTTWNGRFTLIFFAGVLVMCAVIAVSPPLTPGKIIEQGALVGGYASLMALPLRVYQDSRGAALVRPFALPGGRQVWVLYAYLSMMTFAALLVVVSSITFAIAHADWIAFLAAMLAFALAMLLFSPLGALCASFVRGFGSYFASIIVAIIAVRPTFTGSEGVHDVYRWVTPHQWCVDLASRIGDYHLAHLNLPALLGVYFAFILLVGLLARWRWKALSRRVTVRNAEAWRNIVARRGW